mgnify:CR=1 FL=1
MSEKEKELMKRMLENMKKLNHSEKLCAVSFAEGMATKKEMDEKSEKAG